MFDVQQVSAALRKARMLAKEPEMHDAFKALDTLVWEYSLTLAKVELLERRLDGLIFGTGL